jgi:hypothetical protein
MKLILKQVHNKPPMLGRVFNNLFEASTINQDLLENENNERKFKINLEPYGDFLHLRLMSFNPPGIRFYKNVKYDPVRLEKWLLSVTKEKEFLFSHLVLDNEKEVVVRSLQNQKLFTFKIERITLFN